MTRTEFYKKIKESGIKFGFSPYFGSSSRNYIRSNFDCPICALVNKDNKDGVEFQNGSFIVAGATLGLNEDDCRIIAGAADDDDFIGQGKIDVQPDRKLLLEACGL